MKIYKYELEPNHDEINIVGFNKILSVKEQCNRIILYCEINDYDMSMTCLNIDIISTGRNFYFSGMEFIDTIVMDNGLVWHVYVEIIK